MNISLLTNAIVKSVHPARIVLFGSRAEGTENASSDFDILVIEDEKFGQGRSRRKESAKIWQSLMKFNVSKDILLYSVDEFNTFKNDPLHVVAQAMSKGKILYERV